MASTPRRGFYFYSLGLDYGGILLVGVTVLGSWPTDLETQEGLFPAEEPTGRLGLPSPPPPSPAVEKHSSSQAHLSPEPAPREPASLALQSQLSLAPNGLWVGSDWGPTWQSTTKAALGRREASAAAPTPACVSTPGWLWSVWQRVRALSAGGQVCTRVYPTLCASLCSAPSLAM